jgi:hypothetical protein
MLGRKIGDLLYCSAPDITLERNWNCFARDFLYSVTIALNRNGNLIESGAGCGGVEKPGRKFHCRL